MKLLTPLMMILLPMLCIGQSHSHVFRLDEVKQHSNIAHSIQFEINETYLNKLVQQKSDRHTIELPFFNDQTLTLHLEETNLFASGFTLVEKSELYERIHDFSAYKFFRGTIGGHEEGNVSLTISKDEIAGVIHYNNDSYTIGKIKDVDKHIIYKTTDRRDIQAFKCATIDNPNQNGYKPDFNKSATSCLVPVEIYFECDYDMYQSFASVSATAAYVSTLFNEVSSIYAAESINLVISQIVVWSSDDPYTDNEDGIYNFGDSLLVNGFNGDFAHLLSNDPGSNGGIAYIDMFCGATPFAYSDVINSTSPYPTYSWDVQVVAHELGHNFGSQHTHDCVWGVNGDEQIDDCGNIAFGGDTCFDPVNPIIPNNGGTIMSYCHLNAVGINFSEGLGIEPGNLIRQKLSDCFCDNASCVSAEEIIGDGTYIGHPDHGNGASSPNATHADWYYFEAPSDGHISLNACDNFVDTRVWIHIGTCGSLSYQILSDDDCDTGNGDNYASEIIDFPVAAGETYYIEWDDRWSSSQFDWTFSFNASNGMAPCDDTNILLSGNLTDSVHHAKIMIQSDGMSLSGESIMLKAGQEIEFLPGFEVQLGSTIETIIEDCNEN